ncbi:hypothetical protein TNCV_5072421 [Trichonephila clavipes]|nr:hypothetical protein TNCV_5072421 [Trichonephila clavipes]
MKTVVVEWLRSRTLGQRCRVLMCLHVEDMIHFKPVEAQSPHVVILWKFGSWRFPAQGGHSCHLIIAQNFEESLYTRFKRPRCAQIVRKSSHVQPSDASRRHPNKQKDEKGCQADWTALRPLHDRYSPGRLAEYQL